MTPMSAEVQPVGGRMWAIWMTLRSPKAPHNKAMKQCEVAGCDRSYYCREWCRKHYDLWNLRRNRGWQEPIDPTVPMQVGRPPLAEGERKESARKRRLESKQRLSQKARARTRPFILAAKAHPCMDCGNSFPPECMDFDHRPGEGKAFLIASHNTRSLEALAAEIAKCDVVCANCHRMRTTRRLREVHG